MQENGPWTSEAVKLLTKLAAAYLTSSAIAAALYRAGYVGITRNAVIGKVHRLRIPHNTDPHVTNARKPRRPKQPSPDKLVRKPPAPMVIDMPAPSPDDIIRVASLIDLEPHHCRYPIGDPRGAIFGFCGDSKVVGLSYCEHHAMVCYKPIRPLSAVAGKAVHSYRRAS